ncbi:phage holin family protein, partial [Streptomyces alboviridis]|uniref:phage holin family protein n=1 Tax=Streptomyces alboviridis TaxID=67269 RepID=UPI000515F4EC
MFASATTEMSALVHDEIALAKAQLKQDVKRGAVSGGAFSAAGAVLCGAAYAWTLPLGWLVFRRLIPRHVEATAERAHPPSWREIGRFLAGDYTGSLFSLAVVYA